MTFLCHAQASAGCCPDELSERLAPHPVFDAAGGFDSVYARPELLSDFAVAQCIASAAAQARARVCRSSLVRNGGFSLTIPKKDSLATMWILAVSITKAPVEDEHHFLFLTAFKFD